VGAPHPTRRSRQPGSPPSRGGMKTPRSPSRHAFSLLRRIGVRVLRGVARRKAQTYSSAIPCGTTAGASRRASCSVIRGRSRFRRECPAAILCPVWVPHLRAARCRDLAIAAPGGTPGGTRRRPECRSCVTCPQGHRTPSRFTIPHESAPQWTRWTQISRGAGDKIVPTGPSVPDISRAHLASTKRLSGLQAWRGARVWMTY
jgi:hypothetical protein